MGGEGVYARNPENTRPLTAHMETNLRKILRAEHGYPMNMLLGSQGQALIERGLVQLWTRDMRYMGGDVMCRLSPRGEIAFTEVAMLRGWV